MLDKHYLDRDLTRTGNSIVLVSAGAGLFQVSPKLAQITKQRMMDNGIGMDMVSLAQPPLHTVPLFMHPAALTAAGRGRRAPRDALLVRGAALDEPLVHRPQG